jgi:hypothetical protein
MFRQWGRLFLFRGFYGACGYVENFRARGSVGDVFTHLFPENCAIRQHDEHGRDGDVAPFHGYAPLQCHAEILVFEQWIRQCSLFGKFGRIFAGIDADGGNGDASLTKCRMQLCQLTQLDTTIRSPIAAVKYNEGRTVGREFGKRNLLTGRIRQRKRRGGSVRCDRRRARVKACRTEKGRETAEQKPSSCEVHEVRVRRCGLEWQEGHGWTRVSRKKSKHKGAETQGRKENNYIKIASLRLCVKFCPIVLRHRIVVRRRRAGPCPMRVHPREYVRRDHGRVRRTSAP